jgi:hypothetical protein
MPDRDWIDEVAAAVDRRIVAFCGASLGPEIIATIIRQCAPQWRERPTCAGWWVCFDGNRPMLYYVTDISLEIDGEYYGPIPEPPKAS